MGSKNIPTDPHLYARVVAEAKKKFLVWPSAYASGWVVKNYRARGGGYETQNNKKEKDIPLSRWFQEEWVDVCTYLQQNKIQACGRPKARWSDYRYCRPLKRITQDTPTTLQQSIEKTGRENLLERCRLKKKEPEKRMKKI